MRHEILLSRLLERELVKKAEERAKLKGKRIQPLGKPDRSYILHHIKW